LEVFYWLAKKKNEKGVRTGRKIYGKEVEERKTIFPKDGPTVEGIRGTIRP